MSDKKDLTNLSDLFPTTPAEGDAAQAPPSLAPDIPLELDGIDDLLAPMAPTSTGVPSADASFTFSPDTGVEAPLDPSFDPIGSLAPVDPEIEKLAAEANALDEMPPALPGEGGDEILAPPIVSEDAPVSLDEPVPALAETPVGMAMQSALEPEASPDPSLTSQAPPPGISDLKHYSENLAPSSSPVVAATPFSLLIHGHLRTHERESLVQILSRENLGVREVELEPQFQAGHILIPRISEYAGVLIVQALRNSGAQMHLGPSKRIFVSKEADDGSDALIFADNPDTELLMTEDGDSPAEKIQLTPESTIPNRQTEETLDTLHGSMNLKAAHVAQPQSPAFQDSLEKLKRQLKFQAFHRGADALVSFKYDLHPLEGQTVYKLVVQATAVRLA